MADSVRENLRRLAAAAAAGATLAGTAMAETPPSKPPASEPQQSQPISWRYNPDFKSAAQEMHVMQPAAVRGRFAQAVEDYHTTHSVDIGIPLTGGRHLTLKREEGGFGTPLPGGLKNVDFFVTQSRGIDNLPDTGGRRMGEGPKALRFGVRIPLNPRREPGF